MNNADLLELLALEEARSSFWAYRQYMNPDMKLGWYQKEVCKELQTFYEDMIDGKRPKLMLTTPPQHGKSDISTDFITWLSGNQSWMKTIYGSFSKRLGVRANKKVQRIIDSDKYRKLFPSMTIDESQTSVVKGNKIRNSEFLEFANHGGSFRNTTVGGSVTGESLNFGLVDDPIRGRKDASSLLKRDTAWDWLVDDFFTRFSEDAGFLMIMTRWHIDDPAGRWLKHFPETKVLKYEAIATKDEPNRKEGEALFPEHKSLEFLLERKRAMATSSWESLYQQNPIIIGGAIIKGTDFPRYEVLPRINYRKIYADTAQKTAEHNDYSVFECWGYGDDKKIYLLDLIRGKWEAPELRQRAIDFWNKNAAVQDQGVLREMKVEDKSSGTGLIQDIKINARIPVSGIPRTKDKLTRVLDVVSYIAGGYVVLPERASFVSDFVSECESFTADNSHPHDDQIDPMCDAITDMIAARPRSFTL